LTHQLAPGTPKALDVRTGPDNFQMTRKTSRIEIRADQEFIETIAKIAHQTRKSRAKEALNNEGSRSAPGLDLSLANIFIADRA
jgi:hypothetical protein